MREAVSLEEIRAIIELVRDSENVAEFSLKYGDLEISLSRESRQEGARAPGAPPGPGGAVAARPATSAPEQPRPAGPASSSHPVEPREDEVVIKAPMVGTFYRSPKPGEPPFVEVGQAVSRDSVLCIIEVMKLMNSIQAGVEGTVTRILVEDAEPVEYGQSLIFIRKSAP